MRRSLFWRTYSVLLAALLATLAIFTGPGLEKAHQFPTLLLVAPRFHMLYNFLCTHSLFDSNMATKI